MNRDYLKHLGFTQTAITMSNTQLFYFGCQDVAGNYLFPSRYAIDMSKMSDVNHKFFDRIDGTFVPPTTNQGSGQFSQVGKLSIIAWHDYTVDKRPGSNSNIIGYGYEGSRKEIIEAMYEDFKVKFPTVYNRQTMPIIVKGFETITLLVN